MKTKKLNPLDPSAVQFRLGLCAAALAGTAATAPNADATIISFNTPIIVPATFSGIYVNLQTGASGGSAAAVPGFDFNPYLQAGGTLGFYWNSVANGQGGGVANTTTGPYRNLAPGTVINGASIFSSSIAGTAGSPYLTTGTFILGFRFVNSTGATNFGYMTVTNTGTTGFPMTIQNWSYEDSGAAITVPVPEPGTTALLAITAIAFGAVGVRAWRRRQVA